MKTHKPKPCVICGKSYTPTGPCSKYCSKECKAKVWTREVLSKLVYDSQVRRGIIKQPGVGTGHGQGLGPTHHSYKPDAPHRFRDHMKNVCERCGSRKFLCGHHKDRDRSNNEPENIETLCKSCHQKEHECHKNFMVGFGEERRKKLSEFSKERNKTRPRNNLGRFIKET